MLEQKSLLAQKNGTDPFDRGGFHLWSHLVHVVADQPFTQPAQVSLASSEVNSV